MCEREWDEEHVGATCEQVDEKDGAERAVRRVYVYIFQGFIGFISPEPPNVLCVSERTR